MAYIKQFRTGTVRVSDPLRPGKRTFEERLVPTGAHQISHDGVNYDADEDGWFDVPPGLAELLTKRHFSTGERYYVPYEVDEQVRLGAMTQDDAGMAAAPAAPEIKPQRARKGAAPKE